MIKNYKRGEIYYAKLIGVGSMQQGVRPVYIVSNNKANTYAPTVTIIPFTSRTKRNLPTHVNMDKFGTALCECVTTIDKSLLQEKVGEATSKESLKINIGVLIQLGINIFDLVKEIGQDYIRCFR